MIWYENVIWMKKQSGRLIAETLISFMSLNHVSCQPCLSVSHVQIVGYIVYYLACLHISHTAALFLWNISLSYMNTLLLLQPTTKWKPPVVPFSSVSLQSSLIAMCKAQSLFLLSGPLWS